jgi:hypothetical protein
MTVHLTRLSQSVNDAAAMLQAWLGEPGMLTDVYAQVERLAANAKQERQAKRFFREGLAQIRGEQ